MTVDFRYKRCNVIPGILHLTLLGHDSCPLTVYGKGIGQDQINCADPNPASPKLLRKHTQDDPLTDSSHEGVHITIEGLQPCVVIRRLPSAS